MWEQYIYICKSYLCVCVFEVFLLLTYNHNFFCTYDDCLTCVRGVIDFFTLHGIYSF